MNQMGDQAKKFTNVYVKNFAHFLDDDKLRELFDPYGKIISCKVLTNSMSGVSFDIQFITHDICGIRHCLTHVFI